MKTVTIGNVPYLNTKPLVARLYGVEEYEGARVQVVEAVPSRLAEMLARREVSAAMVSSVVPLVDEGLCALRAGAVTSDGPILSIRLITRVPASRIRKLALDASSRTSVVLCRLLLSRVYGLEPEIVSMPPDVPAMLSHADAALVIGDPAMRASVAVARGEIPGICEDLDLGDMWRSEIGLPFVYAMWVAPRDEDLELLTGLLTEAADWGNPRRAEIAAREAPIIGLPVDLCRSYVLENVHYGFGPREWEGLMRFHSESVALGLLPERRDPLECIEGRADRAMKFAAR